MSTLGDIMSTPGDFGTNEKKPLPNLVVAFSSYPPQGLHQL